MAIRTRDELLEMLRVRIGDDTSDEAIALIEDVNDTFTDLETRAAGDGENWRERYEENDRAWRQKYRDRFFGVEVEETKDEEEEETKVKTYDDLFVEEEKK